MTCAKVWVLDRRVFQQVMKKTGMQRIDDNLKFLRSVPLLERLSTDHMAKIADVLEVVSLPPPCGIFFFSFMSSNAVQNGFAVSLFYTRNSTQLERTLFDRARGVTAFSSSQADEFKSRSVFQVCAAHCYTELFSRIDRDARAIL